MDAGVYPPLRELCEQIGLSVTPEAISHAFRSYRTGLFATASDVQEPELTDIDSLESESLTFIYTGEPYSPF